MVIKDGLTLLLLNLVEEHIIFWDSVTLFTVMDGLVQVDDDVTVDVTALIAATIDVATLQTVFRMSVGAFRKGNDFLAFCIDGVPL